MKRTSKHHDFLNLNSPNFWINSSDERLDAFLVLQIVFINDFTVIELLVIGISGNFLTKIKDNFIRVSN